MATEFYSEDVEFPAIDIDHLSSWIDKIIEKEGCETGDISVIFVSDEYLLQVNNQYLEHDYFTDIITFDYSEDHIVSGDLFISVDTVLSNSQDFNVTFLQELHRVIIHGVLHLIGFDDKSDADQEIMTKMENLSLEMM